MVTHPRVPHHLRKWQHILHTWSISAFFFPFKKEQCAARNHPNTMNLHTPEHPSSYTAAVHLRRVQQQWACTRLRNWEECSATPAPGWAIPGSQHCKGGRYGSTLRSPCHYNSRESSTWTWERSPAPQRVPNRWMITQAVWKACTRQQGLGKN